MKTKLQMRSQLRLLVVKTKSDFEIVAAQSVGEREGNFERVFAPIEFVRRNPVSERTLVRTQVSRYVGKGFVTQKTVRTAADFLTAIEAVLVFEPVQVITHHGRVIRPTAGRFREVVVAMEKADPL